MPTGQPAPVANSLPRLVQSEHGRRTGLRIHTMPVFTAKTLERVEAAKTTGTAGGYLNTKDIPTDGDGVRITLLGCDGEDSNSLTYYEVWGEILDPKARSQDGSPARKAVRFADEPTEAEVAERFDELGMVRGTSKFGKVDAVKFGMAFWVWNYANEAVEIFMFTQKPLVEGFQDAFQDPEVGDSPSKWDISLKKVQKAKFVDYTVNLRPGKRADKVLNARIQAAYEEILDKGGNLTALLSGGDPFKNEEVPF